MQSLTLLATFLLPAILNAYSSDATADQITNLPGAEKLDFDFNQFSGYLTVNGTKNLHYWFVESMGNPSTDPVAFWTNGGPGCSGLIGFMTEQGPFRPNADMSLSFNQYAWNQVANMVFISAPCGVGYSYSSAEDTTEDYKMGDAETAQDNYMLIQEFYKRFPEYSENDLYLTSESYGGHYMPTLAKEIVDQNAAGVNPVLPFKGFAVGNPATTVQSTTPAMVQTYQGHQMVAKPTWDKYNEECVLPKKPASLEECETLFLMLFAQVGRNINPYAIDYPVCTEDSVTHAKSGRNQRSWLLSNVFADYSLEFKKQIGLGENPGDLPYEPCTDDWATTYLNQAGVKSALHVKDDLTYEDCSRSIRYDQKDGSNSMVPYYQYLIDGSFGLNILVYSGDNDAVCATVGTQSWIWDMGYDVDAKQFWTPYTVEGQTAGYFTQWKNSKFGFLTIHGAGHEVPTYKPEVALDMFTRYLKGEFTQMV